MPEFYKKAKENYKVERIKRWGIQKDNQFVRKTAFDVIKEYYPNSLERIKSRHKVINIKKTGFTQFEVQCKIGNNDFTKLYCKNLFICAGAGFSPVLLADLGYKHIFWVNLKFTQLQSFINTKNKQYTQIL